MSTSYGDYILKRNLASIQRDAYNIKKIPADELNYEMCCAAMKKAAGDYEFFKWFLEKFSKFVDENLCKIAVSANPKKKFVCSRLAYTSPEGYEDYENLYKYFDPVIKYVPEQFRTVDVCIASAKYDWRTLQFVPVSVQMADQSVCETAVSKYHQIMTDDVDFEKENRKKVIFNALNKSVFEQFTNIFDGTLTLENVSAKWIMANPDKVGAILLKHPGHIKKLPKDFRKNRFNVIRDVAGKNYKIWLYLSVSEQEKLQDITRGMAQKHPDMLACLCEAEQKKLVDLIELALSNGKIKLGAVKPSVQVLIPEVCVGKLTKDPYETHWYGATWAHEPTPGLNLMDLCPELQGKNAELISGLVCEHLELLEYVDINVLIAHPEICVAMIEKWGAMAYEKIPQAVFDKNPDLYEQLFQRCPRILPQLPKKLQTPEKWRTLVKISPVYANSAPRGAITIQDYEEVFANGARISMFDVPPRFRTYEICKKALAHYGNNLDKVPSKIKKEHPDVCEIALSEYPRQIQNVSESIQLKYPYLCKMAVSGEPMSLEFVKSSVKRKYPEICRLAMAQLVADFGRIDATIFPEKLEAQKDTLRSYIPRDVLKTYWDFIHNTQTVITIKKTDYSR